MGAGLYRVCSGCVSCLSVFWGRACHLEASFCFSSLFYFPSLFFLYYLLNASLSTLLLLILDLNASLLHRSTLSFFASACTTDHNLQKKTKKKQEKGSKQTVEDKSERQGLTLYVERVGGQPASRHQEFVMERDWPRMSTC